MTPPALGIRILQRSTGNLPRESSQERNRTSFQCERTSFSEKGNDHHLDSDYLKESCPLNHRDHYANSRPIGEIRSEQSSEISVLQGKEATHYVTFKCNRGCTFALFVS